MTVSSENDELQISFILDKPVFSFCVTFKDHVELGHLFQEPRLEEIYSDVF